MNDGVNPGSIEERGEERAGPTGDSARETTDRAGGQPQPPRAAGPPTLADPGSADQPAEGGREQNDESPDDFGSGPA